jgi:CP family cyanate transporter-like MFS transporter
VLSSVCIIGIMTSASVWTVFWASLSGFSLGAALALGLALAPLLCSEPGDVALTSAAAFAIAYGFAMLVSFVSGVAWDLAGNINAVLIPILLGSLPIFVTVPRFARPEKAIAPAAVSAE